MNVVVIITIITVRSFVAFRLKSLLSRSTVLRGFRGHVLLAFAVKFVAFAVTFSRASRSEIAMPKAKKKFRFVHAGDAVEDRVRARYDRAASSRMQSQDWMADTTLEAEESTHFNRAAVRISQNMFP